MEKTIKIQKKSSNLRVLYDLLSVDYPNINILSSEDLATIFLERFDVKIDEREAYFLRDSCITEEYQDLELMYSNLFI